MTAALLPFLFALLQAAQTEPVDDLGAPEAVTAALDIASPEQGKKIGKVEFEIPPGIERAEVLAVMRSRSGMAFSMSELDLDIRRLFVALPLSNVLVYADPSGDVIDLSLRLLPRVVVSSIDVNGNDHLDREEILAVVDVKEAAEYREGALEKIEPALRKIYAENGYFNPRIRTEVRKKNQRTAEIIIDIDEGPRAKLGRLSVVNSGPPLPWLAKSADYSPGDDYSAERMTEAQADMAEALVEEGYREYQIGEPVTSYNQKTNEVFVGVPVDPGAKIEFKFIGNRFFDERDLAGEIELDENNQLTPGTADEFARRLHELYQRWGFYRSSIEVIIARDDAANKLTYTYQIREGEQRFIEEVEFKGNQFFDDDALYNAQRVRVRRPLAVIYDYSQGTLPASQVENNDLALIQHYQRSGFQSPSIFRKELEKIDGGLRLSYNIGEGQRTLVDEIRFAGNKAFEELRLRRALGINPGIAFDPFAFEAGLDRIRQLYSTSGFIEAKVTGRGEYPQGVSGAVLLVMINEGAQFRVGHIFLQGNTRTKDRVLRRNLVLQTGDLLNPALLLETQRRLYQLGIFGSVSVEILSKDAQARVANIIVKVQEKKNGSLDFGVGIGTADGLSLSAEAAHRNLWGTARSVRASAEVSYRFDTFDKNLTNPDAVLPYPNEFRIETGYREPWLINSEWAGTLNLITERNRREKTYNYTANRVIVGGDRELSEHWRIFPHYWWEKDNFFPKTAPADCDLEDAYPEDPDLQILRRDDRDRCDINPGARAEDVRDINSNVNLGTYYVAGIESVLLGDYRNDKFSPSDGWLTTYRIFYATPQLGSDFHFLRQDVLLGRYIQLAPRWVIAVGLRSGYIRLLSPSTTLIKPHKYVLGGANSVRGYGINEIFVPDTSAVETGEDGGLIMANYQAEIRFPLAWGLGGVLFTDGGQVWNAPRDIGGPLLYSAGPGLRYDTPVGPIRLDVGWKLNRDQAPLSSGDTIEDVSTYEIHFAIGNVF